MKQPSGCATQCAPPPPSSYHSNAKAPSHRSPLPRPLSTISNRHFLNAGETYGPFPTHEIIQLWETGQIAANASYWRAGMPDYRPLAPDIEHLRDMAGTGIS